MNATTKLLDKFRAVRSLPSDNAAAIALGVHRATVSGWRQRGTQAEAHVIAQMARAVGEDEALWLSLIESERARTDADRKVWAGIARRLGAAAALAAVAVLALPYPAAAQSLTDAHPMHYAKSRKTLRRILSRLFPSWHAARIRDASPVLA